MDWNAQWMLMIEMDETALCIKLWGNVSVYFWVRVFSIVMLLCPYIIQSMWREKDLCGLMIWPDKMYFVRLSYSESPTPVKEPTCTSLNFIFMYFGPRFWAFLAKGPWIRQQLYNIGHFIGHTFFSWPRNHLKWIPYIVHKNLKSTMTCCLFECKTILNVTCSI